MPHQANLTQRVRQLLIRGPVVESAVMGRSAVAVCVAFWQLLAIGYLAGITGATTITDVGGPWISTLWTVCFLISGCLLGLVYLVPRETDKNIAELGVLLLFTVAMGVYLAAFLDRASTLDGRLAILALLGSLITNLVGRMVLLGRQLYVVRQTKRATR